MESKLRTVDSLVKRLFPSSGIPWTLDLEVLDSVRGALFSFEEVVADEDVLACVSLVWLACFRHRPKGENSTSLHR